MRGCQTAAADPAVRPAGAGRGVLAVARRSAVPFHLAAAPASGHARRRAGADRRRMVAAGRLRRGRRRSAIITGSRTRRGGASGCSGRVFTAAGARRAGLSMASFPEPAPRYAELQVTTNFSFLRGASHPDELVLTAAALGHQAIAITDRNSFAGIVRAHHAAKEVGIRLVVGCRLDLRDGTSLLAYPTDRAAYGRLTRLLTLGKRRAPKGECHLDYADVVAHGDGQIVVVLPSERRTSIRGPRRGGFQRPRLSRRPPPLSRRRYAAPRPPRRSRRRRPDCRSSPPTTCSTTCPSGARCRTC